MFSLLFACLCLSSAAVSYAQTTTCNSTAISTNSSTCPCPDVFLDVPNLSVDLIQLVVDDLAAHVSLDAKVANLVSLSAGVDVSIKKVNLTISKVKAQVQLVVRLDNVVKIVNKTLDTLDKNPELLTGLVQSISGLLSSLVDSVGNIVERFVDWAGNVVVKTLDAVTRDVLSQQVVGSVLEFPLVSETTNSLGQIVRTVRDPVSGSLIEIILDNATRAVLSTKVL